MSPVSVKARVTFPRISAAAFQHYDDQRTTRVLQGLPGFAGAMRFISEKLLEKAAHLHHLSHCIRLGREQGSELYQQFVMAAETLSINHLPELYLSPEGDLNAYAMGMKQATIVLTRGLVQSMSPDEVLAVMAHELGHVKCDHMVNETVAFLIARFGVARLALDVPVFGQLATMGLQAALMDWSRKAELSCDRASLLVVQDPEVVASVLAKLGGWSSSLGKVNLQLLLDQARDYDALDDESVAGALKLIQQVETAVYLTHPLPIHRVQTLLRWAESDHYRDILAGKYPQEEKSGKTSRHRCGHEIVSGEIWCAGCGDKLDSIAPGGRYCSRCGAPVHSQDARYCGQCRCDLRQPGAILER